MSAVSTEVMDMEPARVMPPTMATPIIAAGLSRIRKSPAKMNARPA